MGSDLLRKLTAAESLEELWSIVDSRLADISKALDIADAESALHEAEEIVLFGAGDFARAVLSAWSGRGFNVRCLVDGDPRMWGGSWQGYKIESPDIIKGLTKRTLVVVAAMNVGDLANKIRGDGARCVFAERDGTVGLIPGHLLSRRRVDCQRVSDSLGDKRSKFVFRSVLTARMFQEFSFPMRGNVFTDRATDHPQYLPNDLIRLSDGEFYVDCGVFDGDSITGFAVEAWSRGLSNWRVVGLEADRGNAALAREKLAALGLEEVDILEGALGSGAESVSDLNLHNCKGQGISGKERSQSIDDLFRGQRPTFIKMDIEGAEKAALLGAEEVIRRARPTLAVCTYHTTADLIDVPLHIMNNFDFYRTYLRHHRAGSLWETVCYAVPEAGLKG